MPNILYNYVIKNLRIERLEVQKSCNAWLIFFIDSY